MKWLSAEYSAEEAVEHGAEQEHAAALERLLVERDGDLDAARRADAAALADAAHDRPAVDAADAADPRSVTLSVRSANSDRISRSASALRPAPRSTRPRWLRLSMLMSRQATAPVWAVSLRLRSCATTGSRGGVGPATQTTSSVDVVEQAEIGAALADRQVLGQVPVGAQRAHAQLGDAAVVVDAGGLASEMNMSVPV